MSNSKVAAAGEAMPKIPDSIRARYRSNSPVDEMEYAVDLLRTAYMAIGHPDLGQIHNNDIGAIAAVIAYAIDGADNAIDELHRRNDAAIVAAGGRL